MSAQVLLAIVTGVLTLLSAGILALLNGWLSGRAGIDENLRSQREELYPALWSATAVVSFWPRVEVTRDGLDKLHRTLRSWYYEKGGLYMSEDSRARYGNVQELIAALLKHDSGPADVLAEERHTDLMKTASSLRTALTEDLDTRRRKSFLERWRRSRRHAKAAQVAKERIGQAEESESTWERREDTRAQEEWMALSHLRDMAIAPGREALEQTLQTSAASFAAPLTCVAERCTAGKSSNAIGRERIRRAIAERVTCPSDRERPRRREFASRGSVAD